MYGPVSDRFYGASSSAVSAVTISQATQLATVLPDAVLSDVVPCSSTSLTAHLLSHLQ